MLFHVDNVDNFVHNLIFQHFFIFLKVENFLPINSPIHIFFKSLCNLLISTLFDIFPCKISYLQYLTKYTQINFILSPFPFVSWQTGYCSLVTFREVFFVNKASQKTRELSLRSKRYFLCLSQEGSFSVHREARYWSLSEQ